MQISEEEVLQVQQKWSNGIIEIGMKFDNNLDYISFAEEFLDTTFGWNQHWINDRLLPRRPWIHQPLYMKIDSLLNNNKQSEKYFNQRKIRA